MHSSAKKRLLPSTLPTLSIDGTIIKHDVVTKFLGVYIDENVTWKHHIDYVSNKVSKNIGILYKARELLDQISLRQLYFAFVHSYLNYTNIAWASTHKSKLEQLFRHLKYVARVINFKDRYTHANPLLKELKALCIYKLNLFNILCLMYKCKNASCPSILCDLYTPKPKNKYVLRDEGFLLEPNCKTKFAQLCINYRGPHIWNTLILQKYDISHCTSYPLFKLKLKEYLLALDDVSMYF